MTAREAAIVVNGQWLTNAQALTLRVALEAFRGAMREGGALGTDAFAKSMAEAYVASCDTLLLLIHAE